MRNDVWLIFSMAEGVENSSIVCCFMTADYQKSENCQLELQYAKTRRKRIIPCMLADRKVWKPSDWLGLITASEIAIDFKDHSDEQLLLKAKELSSRIKEQPHIPPERVKQEPSYQFELIKLKYKRNSRITRVMDSSKSFPLDQSTSIWR